MNWTEQPYVQDAIVHATAIITVIPQLLPPTPPPPPSPLPRPLFLSVADVYVIAGCRLSIVFDVLLFALMSGGGVLFKYFFPFLIFLAFIFFCPFLFVCCFANVGSFI